MRRLREILADSSCELFLIGAQISAVITSAAMVNVNQRLQLRLLSREERRNFLGHSTAAWQAKWQRLEAKW
jgi:hypothetical protein